MKIIVPMAGRGSRLRPHTLTIPKPLIPVAGKPIVHRLVEDIAGVLNQDIDEVAFIIHESFGKQVEKDLIAIAEKLGAKVIWPAFTKEINEKGLLLTDGKLLEADTVNSTYRNEEDI